MKTLRFLWSHAFDVLILALVVTLGIVTVRDHRAHYERITLPGPNGRGTSVYDRASLQRILSDVEIRDQIDWELDASWRELADLHDSRVNNILLQHYKNVKQLQAKLK